MWSDLRPKRDKKGRRWNFRLWYEFSREGVLAERLFFWMMKKSIAG